MAKYKYHFRPGYGSDEFLIEIFGGAGDSSFMDDLLLAVSAISPIASDSKLWVGEGIHTEFGSACGPFSVATDTWGLAFIMAEGNRKCIYIIHTLLLSSPNFENVPVNNDNYK